MVEIFLCITGKHIRKQDTKGKAKDYHRDTGMILSKGSVQKMKNCKSNNNAKIIDGLEETISYLRTRTSEISERCIQYQREAIALLKEQKRKIEILETERGHDWG